MPGGERRAAQPAGEVEHRVDAQLAVADHARVRGAPGAIAGDELVDDPGAEVGLQVEREVGHVQRVRQPPGAEHRQRRAAAPGCVGALVGPQLERHRDHLRPALALAQRRDCGVDAAAEGHQHPLAPRGRRCQPGARAGRGGERAVQRVGGQIRGVPALGPEPTELRRDRVGADPGRVEDVGVVRELGGRRCRRGGGRAALGVEAHAGDRPVSHLEREADQVAAGGAARSPVEPARERRRAPARVAQVVLEGLGVHPLAGVVGQGWH